MRGFLDGGGCFPTGRHYPGIAHLIRITVEGLAAEWDAQVAVRDIVWVSIDTETTGRDPGVDRLVEVGCVVFQGGRLVEQKGWLIHPGCPIAEEATAVHGITDADVAEKPRFAEVAGEISDFLKNKLPLAYNADFDRDFLHAEFGRAGLSFDTIPALRPDTAWIDPLVWARELQKEHKSRALKEVCERLGIALENAHRATDDALAAGRVMAAFVNDSRVPVPYGAFVKEQRRLARLFEFERVRWRR